VLRAMAAAAAMLKMADWENMTEGWWKSFDSGRFVVGWV